MLETSPLRRCSSGLEGTGWRDSAWRRECGRAFASPPRCRLTSCRHTSRGCCQEPPREMGRWGAQQMEERRLGSRPHLHFCGGRVCVCAGKVKAGEEGRPPLGQARKLIGMGQLLTCRDWDAESAVVHCPAGAPPRRFEASDAVGGESRILSFPVIISLPWPLFRVLMIFPEDPPPNPQSSLLSSL